MMAAMSNGEPIRDLRLHGDYRQSLPQSMPDYQINEIMAGFYANANVRRDNVNTHQPVKMEPQAVQVTAEPRREHQQTVMSLDAISFPSITLPPAPEGCVLPHLRDVVEPIIKEYNAQYMWAIQQQQQTMAFGATPVGTYPSYVIAAGPVPNAFPPQMNPYLNPQAIANPASKSPPTSSAPSQPFINQYAQPSQPTSIPSGISPYAAAQMGQNQSGQPPANWAEFIPANQVSSTNGTHKSEESHKSASKSTNGHVNKEAHTEPKSSSSAHSPVNDKKSAFSPKLKSNELEEQAKQALFAMADQVLEFERSTESRKRRTPETPVEVNANKKQKVSPVPITAHRF